MIWVEFSRGKLIMMNMEGLLVELTIMPVIKRKEYLTPIIIPTNGGLEKLHMNQEVILKGSISHE